MSTAPSFIFVHGGWHNSSCYSKVVTRLETLGLPCECVDLPSSGQEAGTKTAHDDAQVIRAAVQRRVDKGERVIVVCHSNSGISTCAALENLGLDKREKAGNAGGVAKIAMIAAFIVNNDFRFADVPDLDTSWWVVKGDKVNPDNPQHLFYNDLEPAEADYWAAQLRPMTFPPTRPTQYFAWRDIPISYLMCEKDNALALASQQYMIEKAVANGARIETERCSSSHSPFLSMPERVVEWLLRLIER